MDISAEIRWFWPDTPPSGLEEWFHNSAHHPCPAGGGQLRTDIYLRDPDQDELGVKRRGSKPGVEVKGKITKIETALAVGPLIGTIELWAKWTSKALTLEAASTIKCEKVRWLRTFDTSPYLAEEIPLNDKELPMDEKRQLPSQGCNVELTKVEISHQVWWTFSLEAFGNMQTVENNLRKAAGVLASRRLPSLGEAQLASYPLWLASHFQES